MAEPLHKGSFQARGDDGRKYIVHVYELAPPPPPPPTHATPDTLAAAPPATFLRTTGDQEVRRIEKGTYEIVRDGTVLKSDSPNAP